MLRTRLLWPDQHRADSCQPHQSAAEQESGDLIGEEPRPQHLPESAAHRGTTGKERRHRATHIGRHSVGQGRNDRRDHHVQANHAYAVADADQPYIVKETDQCKRYAADNAARNDPGGAPAESRASVVRQIAHNEIGQQRDERRACIDDAECSSRRIRSHHVAQALRQQDGRDHEQARAPQQGKHQERCEQTYSIAPTERRRRLLQ